MKIKEAIYSHTFHNIATGEWDKVGLIGELEEGDDYRQCLYQLRKNVHNFHFESNKAAEKEEAIIKANSPPYNGASLISDIHSCTEVKVLKSYEMLVKNKPELQAAYDQQFKKLTNETNI